MADTQFPFLLLTNGMRKINIDVTFLSEKGARFNSMTGKLLRTRRINEPGKEYPGMVERR
jgi:hypothetical protein